MFVKNKDKADKRKRAGLISHFMLGQGDVEGDALAVTWVDVEPQGKQIPHHHPEVQVYVIVAGLGVMRVGEKTRAVQAGDLIAIPSGVLHGIENIGKETLSYVSAATPAFDLEQAYDRGQLIEDAYTRAQS